MIKYEITEILEDHSVVRYENGHSITIIHQETEEEFKQVVALNCPAELRPKQEAPRYLTVGGAEIDIEQLHAEHQMNQPPQWFIQRQQAYGDINVQLEMMAEDFKAWQEHRKMVDKLYPADN